MILLDEIEIDGTQVPGRVMMRFSNISMDIDVASAREIAAALLSQADVSELEQSRAL